MRKAYCVAQGRFDGAAGPRWPGMDSGSSDCALTRSHQTPGRMKEPGAMEHSEAAQRIWALEERTFQRPTQAAREVEPFIAPSMP